MTTQLAFIGHDAGHKQIFATKKWNEITGYVHSGLVGVSYGGWLTLLGALVAPDLDFLIALVPPVDIVAMLRHSTTIVRGIRRGIGFARLDRAELVRLARPVTPLYWSPRLPPCRIVLHGARYAAVDPIPRVGEPESEIGFFACHHPPVDGVFGRARTLAGRLGADPDRTVRWAAVWMVLLAASAWRDDQPAMDALVGSPRFQAVLTGT